MLLFLPGLKNLCLCVSSRQMKGFMNSNKAVVFKNLVIRVQWICTLFIVHIPDHIQVRIITFKPQPMMFYWEKSKRKNKNFTD